MKTENMKLSVLVCSIRRRLADLAVLLSELERQAQGKPVEILWLGDNCTMTVGEKRNKLLGLAKGDYVCFVDDDDMVEEEYLCQILRGVEQNPDVVCFDVGFSNAELGGPEIPAVFSIHNVFNRNFKRKRVRMPNHLMAVKREHALRVGFTEKSFGEDTDYGLRLRGNSKATCLLKTEYHCGKVLYHYRFNPKTSATHHLNPVYRAKSGSVERVPMVRMDVVMVSDATLAPHPPKGGDHTATSQSSFRGLGQADMTQRAIDSIAADDVNIIVLEKDARIKYNNADTFLQKQPFNYNQCLNDGARMGNAEFICFTNNDVLFPEGFVEQMLEEFRRQGEIPKQVRNDGVERGECHAELVSASQTYTTDVVSVQNQYGYMPKDIISGFCFVMRRSAWQKMGGLNTDYKFWCADNVTTEQIKKHGQKETKSDIRVTHFTSVSLNKLDTATREEYTRGCVKQFNRDYNQDVLGIGI